MSSRPKVGEIYQLLGTQITAKVTAVSIGWITLEVSDATMSMNWRQSSAEFQRRWHIVKKVQATA